MNLYQSQPSRMQGAANGLAYHTKNDLPENVRHSIVGVLNQSLADTTDIQSQFKFAHWNVKGPDFYQLHLLFDEIAEELASHQDLIAERATALGGQALGTVRLAATNSRIPEIATDAVTGQDFLNVLASNLAVHAANLRQDVMIAEQHGDEDTQDMYTELSREVDKLLYFVESHLQSQPIAVGVGASATSAPADRSIPGQASGQFGPGQAAGRSIGQGMPGPSTMQQPPRIEPTVR